MDQKIMPELTINKKSFPQKAHLTDYLNIIRKRKWVAITFFFAVVSVVTIKTFSTTPIYKATTQIIIESLSSFMNDKADVIYTDPKEQGYYQTQYKLLKSKSLAKEVIEDLELYKDIGISNVKKQDSTALSFRESSSSLVSSRTDTSSRSFMVSGEQISPFVVDWYLSNLEVKPVRNTNLVNISFLNSSPEIVASVANEHALAFIKRNIQVQNLASQQALDSIKRELREHKIKAERSQRAINESKYEQLNSFSINEEGLFSLPEIMQNPVIQHLHSQLVKQKTRKKEMATKYGPKYPKMIETSSSIKQLEQEIVGEVQRLKTTLKAEIDRAVDLEKTIQQTQDVQQALTVPIAEKAINYDMLQLEAESDQKIYNILLKQAKEINLVGKMARNSIRIVDYAEVPRLPIKPRKALNIFLSVIIGLTVGIGLAFFREYMDNTVRDPVDITQRLGISILGVMAYDKSLKKEKILKQSLDKPDNEDKEVVNGYAQNDISGSLITGMPLMQSGMSGQIILMDSTTAGEGKTTVLAKSAINLARGGLRVVMVDANLQRPSLHRLFGLKKEGKRGLFNAITEILSYKIRRGSLKKCSVDDIFFLLALEKKSGRLIIKNDNQTMTVIFENGRLFHIQSKDIPIANRLGTMLLRGGFITESQLKDALERHQRTGQPLGYILINAGYVNQAQLQGPLKLQMEEHLQKLFSWKQGMFIFLTGAVETYEDERIYFQEDYTPITNRLGRMTGSRLLESHILSHVKPLNEPNLSLLPAGTKPDSWYFWKGIFYYGDVGTGQTKQDSPLYYKLLARYLDLLKRRYDIVLVDGPPMVDKMGSATPLLPLVDGVIFVVKSGKVSIRHINEAKSQIDEAKTKIYGAILNQVKI